MCYGDLLAHLSLNCPSSGTYFFLFLKRFLLINGIIKYFWKFTNTLWNGVMIHSRKNFSTESKTFVISHSYNFLDMFSHLYKTKCQSVRPSICLSVTPVRHTCPSHIFHFFQKFFKNLIRRTN